MLDAGEIDALFSANVPQCVLDGSPNVARLFPDFGPLERDYHRRTGTFPIMHVIVVRRARLREHPGLARSRSGPSGVVAGSAAFIAPGA